MYTNAPRDNKVPHDARLASITNDPETERKRLTSVLGYSRRVSPLFIGVRKVRKGRYLFDGQPVTQFETPMGNTSKVGL